MPGSKQDSQGGLRSPDFFNVNFSIGIPGTSGLVGWNFTASLDRYGNLHWSPIGISIAKAFVGGASVSVTANYLVQSNKPSERQLNDFLTGNGMNIGGGYWLGGGISISPTASTWAGGVGFYTPQAGGSYNYTPSSPFFNPHINISW